MGWRPYDESNRQISLIPPCINRRKQHQHSTLRTPLGNYRVGMGRRCNGSHLCLRTHLKMRKNSRGGLTSSRGSRSRPGRKKRGRTATVDLEFERRQNRPPNLKIKQTPTVVRLRMALALEQETGLLTTPSLRRASATSCADEPIPEISKQPVIKYMQ